MQQLQLFKSFAMIFHQVIVDFRLRQDGGGVGCAQLLQFPKVLICLALCSFKLGLGSSLF